jgi:uncharacterized protein YegL
MGLLDTTESVPRRTMTMFFMIDTSGSMEGSKIGAVNSAMEEVMPIIGEISENNPDAEIKIAVLDFSSDVKWLYDEPKSANNFQWRDVDADGLTSLGEACINLEEKLHKSNGFMNSASGSFAPTIILMSDGEPTDNYQVGLNKLKSNNWFKSALKFAIAIGDDANKDVLEEFTGSKEAILTVHNTDALKKIIRMVSVTSSQIASTSTTSGDKTKQEQMNEKIQEQTEGMGGVDTVDTTNPTDDDWD